MIPAPGSHDATRQGCSCPPTANGYGVGVPGSPRHAPVFEIRESCQLHGGGSGYVWIPRAPEPYPVMAPWAEDTFESRRREHQARRAA